MGPIPPTSWLAGSGCWAFTSATLKTFQGLSGAVVPLKWSASPGRSETAARERLERRDGRTLPEGDWHATEASGSSLGFSMVFSSGSLGRGATATLGASGASGSKWGLRDAGPGSVAVGRVASGLSRTPCRHPWRHRPAVGGAGWRGRGPCRSIPAGSWGPRASRCRRSRSACRRGERCGAARSR